MTATAGVQSWDLTSGDLVMNQSGQLATVYNFDCISQSIATALQLWLGEYNYDSGAGIPYRILLGNPDSNVQQVLTFQIQKAIMSVNDFMTQSQFNIYGVKSITNVQVKLNTETRQAVFLAQINFINGTKQQIMI